MPGRRSYDLKNRVIMAARQFGISMVLFRQNVADQLGLNVTDMECLALLFHKGLSTPTALAQHTGLSSGATTAMLDRLERAGLIERRPNPDDRRGTLVVLAGAGAAKVGPWFDGIRAQQNALVSRYSQEDLAAISRFLEEAAELWEVERQSLRQRLTKR